MNLAHAFINPRTNRIRAGWRVLVFMALSPQLILPLFVQAEPPKKEPILTASLTVLLLYTAFIGWTLLASWFCLRFLDRLNLTSLGLTFYRGWWRELSFGLVMGPLMMAMVVGLQFIGGGTRVTPNPVWWQSGTVNYAGLPLVASGTSSALLLLILAGAFEELNYRGYPFQTLLRDLPALIPVLLFALLFGIAHWGNPNRTFFSTANTVLAGIWLSMAYLKTRGLWLPTSLHFTWNWTMGGFFGLPVSGLLISRHPIFLATSETPVWLTGGSYGCEGGAAATIVLIAATIFIWRTKWLKVSPAMQAVWDRDSEQPSSALS